MIEETHTLKCHYNGVQPFVKVTAYELSSVDCSSDKNSGYYGETATLTANAAPAGYNFSGWNITGSQMTGNSFRFQGDVTAKAEYSAIQYNVTLQNDGHGTIAANKTTGNIGDTVTLSNTPATHYHFDHYATTGATLTGSQFKFDASDVTAKGFFAADPSYSVTLQTDGHGKIAANKTTGYAGDTVTLSNTASAGYSFKNYTVTGATINGSTLTFGNGNCTAKANYTENTTGNFLFSGKYNTVLSTGGKTYYLKNGYITGGFYYSGTVPSSRVLNYSAINWANVPTAYRMGTYYFKNGIKVANISGYGYANVTQTASQSLYFDFAYASNGGYLDVQSRGLMFTGSHTGTASSASMTIYTDVANGYINPHAYSNGNVNPAVYTGYFIISGKLTG